MSFGIRRYALDYFNLIDAASVVVGIMAMCATRSSFELALMPGGRVVAVPSRLLPLQTGTQI